MTQYSSIRTGRRRRCTRRETASAPKDRLAALISRQPRQLSVRRLPSLQNGHLGHGDLKIGWFWRDCVTAIKQALRSSMGVLRRRQLRIRTGRSSHDSWSTLLHLQANENLWCRRRQRTGRCKKPSFHLSQQPSKVVLGRSMISGLMPRNP